MCYLKKGRQLIVKMTSQQKKQEALNILLKKGSTINSLNGQQAEKKLFKTKITVILFCANLILFAFQYRISDQA